MNLFIIGFYIWFKADLRISRRSFQNTFVCHEILCTHCHKLVINIQPRGVPPSTLNSLRANFNDRRDLISVVSCLKENAFLLLYLVVPPPQTEEPARGRPSVSWCLEMRVLRWPCSRCSPGVVSSVGVGVSGSAYWSLKWWRNRVWCALGLWHRPGRQGWNSCKLVLWLSK